MRNNLLGNDLTDFFITNFRYPYGDFFYGFKTIRYSFYEWYDVISSQETNNEWFFNELGKAPIQL